MSEYNICACIGLAFGEPYCSCKMVSMGIERSDEYKEYMLPENVESRNKELQEKLDELCVDYKNKVNEYHKTMMDEAIASIDTLSIDELESEFKTFGIDVVRKQENNIYIVTAYRFGCKENHSYVLGAFSTKEEAIRQAKIEEEWRGGKYDCEVIVMKLNDSLKYKNYEVVYTK